MPRCDDCAYQAIQVGSDWYASTDYETHQTSLTKAQAVTDPDGMMRFVDLRAAAAGEGGIANWLETTGHRTGALMLRWQRLERDLSRRRSARRRRHRVDLEDVEHLPHLRPPLTPRSTPRGSRPAALRGPKDDQLSSTTATQHATPVADAYRPVPLLQDKVVVLSGVGPGLGRSLGEEAARMGADLVLVSRTERRLEKMAEVVRSHGRRALVVPTDITDEDSRAALVERTLEEFGKVDCLINNAFGIPPMDPISTIELEDAARRQRDQRVRAAAALGALRRRARGPHGSVIMLNSCVVRSARSRSTPATSSPRAPSSTSPPRWPPSSARAASGSTRWRRPTSTRT